MNKDEHRTDEGRDVDVTFSKHAKSIYSGWQDIEPPRPLTPEERDLVGALLRETFPGCEELRAQATDVLVSSRCTCGCLSVGLAVADESPRADIDVRVPVEAHYNPSPETVLHVLLHVIDGTMSKLEFVDFDTGAGTTYPPHDELEFFIPYVTKIWSDE